MSESLFIPTGSRQEIYEALLPQLEGLLQSESNTIANLANTAAVLKESLGFFWVGFYLATETGEELVLGPFQGPLACTRIAKGRGVCGTSFAEARTVIVPDVDQFPGHIACSSRSRSEIVVPLRRASGEVWGVLDIDSEELSSFDELDARYLERLVCLL